MNRSYRSFLLGLAGLTVAGAAIADDDAALQNRLREAYRAGFRRARTRGLEQIRELSDSRVRLARRLVVARRLHDALLVELEAAKEALNECHGVSIPGGEMPGDIAALPPSGAPDELAGAPSSGETGGIFGLPDQSADAPGTHGPITLPPLGTPLTGDPRLVEAGARGVVAGVQRDVEVAGTVAQETLGVAGTSLQQQGELIRTGADAVGTVAGGYVEAVRGLGEDRSLLGHAGHTVRTVASGWGQAAQDVGGQYIEGQRVVWGRAWEGAQRVGSTWWEGTEHLTDEILSPFRSEESPQSD